jgi:hypothetical protein
LLFGTPVGVVEGFRDELPMLVERVDLDVLVVVEFLAGEMVGRDAEDVTAAEEEGRITETGEETGAAEEEAARPPVRAIGPQ